MVGKTNMDEFCMGTSSTSGMSGAVRNPWSSALDTDWDWHVAGGSSGGSAVAVATGMARLALGSDTGGSARNPAAWTALLGLKPTYGALSRHGLIPLVNSLDAPAIMANSAADIAAALAVTLGADPLDSTSRTPPYSPPSLLQLPQCMPKTLRIGIPKEYRISELTDEVLTAWEEIAEFFASEGAQVKNVSLPQTGTSIVCYHVIGECDVASNMGRYDGVEFGHRSPGEYRSADEMYAESRSSSLGEVVRRRIMAGNYFLLTEYPHDESRYDGVEFGHRLPGEYRSADEMYAESRSSSLGEVVRRRIMAGNYFLLTEYPHDESRYDGVEFGHRLPGEYRSADEMYAESRSSSLGEVVRRRIMAGNYFLLTEYPHDESRYDGVEFGHRSPGEYRSADEMYAESRSSSLGEVVRRRIMAGNYFLLTEYPHDESRYDGVEFGHRSPGEYRSADEMYAESRSSSLGEVVRRRIMAGNYFLLTEYPHDESRYDGVEFGHRSPGEYRSADEMYAESRSSSLGEVVRRRIMAGNYFLLTEYSTIPLSSSLPSLPIASVVETTGAIWIKP